MCPQCRHDLKLTNEICENNEIKSGTLACDNQHYYEIKNFVPHFSKEEVYVDAFDLIHKKEAISNLPIYKDQSISQITKDEFLRQTGFDPKDLNGKLLLDAGCGGGRFVTYLRQYGVEVVGIDLRSDAVMKCGERYQGDQKAHFIQASLFSLPFRENCFDYIYSLGVLHHTPDPKTAFTNLTRLLKKDGKIAIWVYPKHPSSVISDLLRPLTTRMPLKLLLFTARVVTALYGPFLKIPKIGVRLKKFLYGVRLPWHDQYNWRIHSFMDWYGPPYQFKFTDEEVKRWFEEVGLSEIKLLSDAISAQGTKQY